MKSLAKRLLVLFVCSLGVVILLGAGFRHSVLSEGAFQISTLLLAFGMGAFAVLLIDKSAKEFKAAHGPIGTPKDATSRKHRLMGIRAGQVSIVILSTLLAIRLRGIGSDPLWPLLATVAINVWILLTVIWAVVHLKRKVN